MGGATDRKILRRAQRLPTICLPPIGQAAFLLCVLCALLWQFLPRSPSHICLPPEMLLSSFVLFVPSCGNSSGKASLLVCVLSTLLWPLLSSLCPLCPLVAIPPERLLYSSVFFLPSCGHCSPLCALCALLWQFLSGSTGGCSR